MTFSVREIMLFYILSTNDVVTCEHTFLCTETDWLGIRQDSAVRTVTPVVAAARSRLGITLDPAHYYYYYYYYYY